VAGKKKTQKKRSNKSPINTILQGDCVELMQQLPDGYVDLVFADPPFNIGYKYDIYDDRKSVDEYLEWSRSWIGEVHRILKDDGSFWLAIGDDFAAELKVLCQQLGFHTRNWVIWYYTFGVHCKTKFTRSHTHLLYFVKDPKQFTFNRDAIAVPSARQLVYNDSRGNPNGRVPDDTWILRPQDCQDGFTPDEDCWYFPRVAGTFKERAGFHGCQMPEQLLGRIIRCCSRAGELVFDPFSGSASTSVVAKKLHRNYLAFELSDEYTTKGQERIDAVQPGDPLDGAEEPKISAPVTYPVRPKGRKRSSQKQGHKNSQRSDQSFEKGLLESFAEAHEGFSVDRLIADPTLDQHFLDVCARKGLEGEPQELNRYLFRLRKSGKLKSAGIETTCRTTYSWEELDQFIDASEIAWKRMVDEHDVSLEECLCDPLLASEFDQIADRIAPGFESVDYRWAAMTVRKQSKDARSRARKLMRMLDSEMIDSRRARDIEKFDWEVFDETPGLYVVQSGSKNLYAGESFNLRQRLRRRFQSKNAAIEALGLHGQSLKVWLPEIELRSNHPSHLANELLGYQSMIIAQYDTRLNALNQTAS
jgi:site-specific DNA-methyltransferase (adenine-specific)